jgi:hypothetical protein
VRIAGGSRLVLVLELLLGLLLSLLFVFSVLGVRVSGLLQILAVVHAIRVTEGVWKPDVELTSSCTRTKPGPSLVSRREFGIALRMLATVHDSVDA